MLTYGTSVGNLRRNFAFNFDWRATSSPHIINHKTPILQLYLHSKTRVNVADASSTLSFLGKYVEDQEEFLLADMDFGSAPMGTTQDCVLVLAVAALAAERPPGKA